MICVVVVDDGGGVAPVPEPLAGAPGEPGELGAGEPLPGLPPL